LIGVAAARGRGRYPKVVGRSTVGSVTDVQQVTGSLRVRRRGAERRPSRRAARIPRLSRSVGARTTAADGAGPTPWAMLSNGHQPGLPARV